MPLIHVMNTGAQAERLLVKSAIEAGDASQFDAILAAVQRCGSLAYTRSRAQSEAQAAQQALAEVPPGAYRHALEALTTLAVNRQT
jgi:octaprenyl-diphosphate synthase